LERLVLQPDAKSALSQLAVIEIGLENTEACNPALCSSPHVLIQQGFSAPSSYHG
jgi:hypothetical protein